MRCLDGITDSMDMSLSELQKLVRAGRPGVLCFTGSQRVDSLEKDSDAERDWGQDEKGTTEDEMAGWHHWLDGRESE